MSEDQKNDQNLPKISEDNKKSSEGVPKPSEKLRNISEVFPKGATSRSPDHTLTVKDVLEELEQASVARTERSIINWLVKNKHGIARLDGYYDQEEHKWYITPQSVRRLIEEEQKKRGVPFGKPSEDERNSSEILRNGSEKLRNTSEFVPKQEETDPIEINKNKRINALERENYQLRVSNGASEHIIKHYEEVQAKMLDQIMGQSKQIGELETKLLQLEGPKQEPPYVVESEIKTTGADEQKHDE